MKGNYCIFSNIFKEILNKFLINFLHYRYKIYELYLQNEDQLEKFLNHFDYLLNESLLTTHHRTDHSIHLVIPPGDEFNVLKYLQANNINFKIINHNVAESIRRERKASGTNFSTTTNVINFENYQRYDVINNYMDYLKEQYPERVEIISVGRSYEGRDMKAIRIKNNAPVSGNSKPLIFIDAGIHAREWIAIATALYAMQQLVENATSYAQDLELYDWLILPIVNPDGYEYSHNYDRLWRKNRRQFNNSTTNCTGVDLNRNFDYYWAESGVSTNPCSEIYCGPLAFSEPESQNLKEFLLKINDTCLMYLTLHSYGNYLLYPWGYETYV